MSEANHKTLSRKNFEPKLCVPVTSKVLGTSKGQLQTLTVLFTLSCNICLRLSW